MAAKVIFALGVSADVLAGYATPQDSVYTDTLSLESSWRTFGGRADYLYRGCGPVFEQAAEAALAWLEQFPARLRASGIAMSEIQLPGHPPLWTLCQDAVFEIKDGLFEGILHAFLVRDIQMRHVGMPIWILAPQDLPLAQAIAAWTGGRMLGLSDTAQPASQEPRPTLLSRLWNAADTLLISPTLVRLGRLFSPPNGSRLAIVNSLGPMTRLFPERFGRKRLGDSYFEGIEPALSKAYPGLLKIGLNPPSITPGVWRNQWLTWHALLRGEYRPWFFYAGWRDFLRHARDLRHYAEVLARSEADDRFRGLFQVEGLDFYLPVRQRIRSLLPVVLASLRLHHTIAQRLVEVEGLRMVVSAEAFSNIGRCMAAALHRAGGQLFGVQAGIITPQRVTNLGFYVPALAGHDECIPDRFFVWGPRYVDLLTRYGVPHERLVLMGFNRAKGLLTPVKLAQQVVLYVTGGNALVCPYLMTADEERVTLEHLATHLPAEAELVVRTHPRHRVEDFHWLELGFPRVRLCSGAEQSLEDSLREADCVVGKASTVLLEAASAGKRVLLLNLAGTPEFTGFADATDGLPYVTDASHLRAALERVLAQPPRTVGFAEAWSMGTASDAAQRFLKAIAHASQDLAVGAPSPTIAFLCSSALHVRLFAPVIRYLQSHGILRPLIVSLDSFYEDLHGNVALELIAQKLSVDIEAVTFRHGASPVRWWRGAQTVWAARWCGSRQYQSMLRQWQVSLLVLGNDTGLAELVAIDAARASKVPTLLVQDGFVSNDLTQGGASSRRRLRVEKLKMMLTRKIFGGRPYGLGGCDSIAAYGQYWADLFKALNGSKTRRIEVVGHPCLSFERAAPPPAVGASVTYFCTNFLRSNLRDTVAHQAQLAEIEAIRDLLDTCGEQNRMLRVKPHPADKLEDYSALEDRRGIELAKTGTLAEIIAASWLCITNLSSVVWDCASEERPCLMSGLSIAQGPYASLYMSLPGLKAENPATLRDWILQMQTQSGLGLILEAQRQSLAPFVSVDPLSTGTERLARLIIELASEKRGRVSR